MNTSFYKHKSIIAVLLIGIAITITCFIMNSKTQSEMVMSEKTLVELQKKKSELESLSEINTDASVEDNPNDDTFDKKVDVVYVSDDFQKVYPDGFTAERKLNDDNIMIEWVRPAFTFANVEEYKINRQIFVDRLGAVHPFVNIFMPQYTAPYDPSDPYAEIEDVDISSELIDIDTFVLDIENDVYTYVAYVNRDVHISSADERVILTYNISSDGSIRDFNAVTPYDASPF